MKIRYERMEKMLPRDGVKYSTVYVKQRLEDRKQLVRHIQRCAKDIQSWVDANEPGWREFMQEPQRGFPTTKGVNRTPETIVVDLILEAQGRTRQGLPKDFALAPIERWNKLFKDTEFQFELTTTPGSVDQFERLMEFAND